MGQENKGIGKGEGKTMIRCFKKIEEVGWIDFDYKTNRDVIKRGLLLGGVVLTQERLLLDKKTKMIMRVPKGAILQGRTLRKLERKLEKYYED